LLLSPEQRHQRQDATHGLRAAELVDLRWEQVDQRNATLRVRRVKQGSPATHPLTDRELRALRRLQREQKSKSPFVFALLVSTHTVGTL
jgi:integrase